MRGIIALGSMMSQRSPTLGGGNVQWTFKRANREAGSLASRSKRGMGEFESL